MDEGRKHDVKIVEKGLKSPDPLMRKVAREAGRKIKEQLSDKWTRDARERLIKETMEGNTENAYQVRDEMVRHRGGRLGKGNWGGILSTAFHWAPSQWEKIYGHHISN